VFQFLIFLTTTGHHPFNVRRRSKLRFLQSPAGGHRAVCFFGSSSGLGPPPLLGRLSILFLDYEAVCSCCAAAHFSVFVGGSRLGLPTSSCRRAALLTFFFLSPKVWIDSAILAAGAPSVFRRAVVRFFVPSVRAPLFPSDQSLFGPEDPQCPPKVLGPPPHASHSSDREPFTSDKPGRWLRASHFLPWLPACCKSR